MKRLKTWIVTISTVAVTGGGIVPAGAQSASHPLRIDNNLPQPPSFAPYLQRALLNYFRRSGLSSATSIEYTLLREGPTQAGVAQPKFYAWVQVKSGNALLQQGAVRLATHHSGEFEVVDFLSAQQIRFNKRAVSSVFPAALVPVLRERANSI